MLTFYARDLFACGADGLKGNGRYPMLRDAHYALKPHLSVRSVRGGRLPGCIGRSFWFVSDFQG